MTREEALQELEEPPYDENLAIQDLEYIANKLDLTKDEFVELMNGNNKTYRDYKSSIWLINLAVKAAKLLGIEKRNFR